MASRGDVAGIMGAAMGPMKVARRAGAEPYKLGGKSRAICDDCGLVETTFQYRDVPFRSGVGNVKNILVSVCDQCGAVVAIPAQSAPAIKAALEALERGDGCD